MLLYFLISHFGHSVQFRLKHASKNSFVCQGTNSGGKFPLVECDNENKATDFKIETSPDGTGFFSPVDNSIVFDVAEEWKVVMNGKHGEPNQRFQLTYISPDKYAIVNRGKCLTLEGTSFHHMRECSYGNDQLYAIVYNDNEKKELTTSLPQNKSVAGDTSAPDSPMMDKLTRMINDNKEIASRIAFSHAFHHHGHPLDHHSHHHDHEKKKKHIHRFEEGPFLLDYINKDN